MDHLRETVRDNVVEVSNDLIDRIVNKFLYKVLPNIWHEHAMLFYHHIKEVLTTRNLKVDKVLSQTKSSIPAIMK